MLKKNRLFLGLGAVTALLAAPFVMSACKTAGSHARADAMISKGEVVGEKTCSCGKTDQECDCKKCQGDSCWGGGGKDSSGNSSCGGK